MKGPAWLGLGLGLAAGMWPTVLEAALPTDILANQARRATVLVKNREGKQSTGTGFFIQPDLLVTNKHVLESLQVELVDENGRTQIGTCVAEAKEDDLALIRAMTTGGYLSLRPGEPKYGEKVFVMGNPRGLQSTFSDGIVSHPVKKYPGGEFFQHTAPTSPGSSGSAVLDVDGRVIGVVCSGVLESQNLNFAIPVSRLKDLIQKWRLGLARPTKKNPVAPASGKPCQGGGGGPGSGGMPAPGPSVGGGGSSGGSSKDPEEELQDLLAKARALFIKGELEAAGDLYEQITRNHPKRPEAFIGLGAVRAKQDRYPDALGAYEEAGRLAPRDGRVDFERGKFYFRAQQPDKALEEFRRSIDKDPRREAAWEAAAEILRGQGKPQEASELLREGIRKNPQWEETPASPAGDKL